MKPYKRNHKLTINVQVLTISDFKITILPKRAISLVSHIIIINKLSTSWNFVSKFSCAQLLNLVGFHPNFRCGMYLTLLLIFDPNLWLKKKKIKNPPVWTYNRTTAKQKSHYFRTRNVTLLLNTSHKRAMKAARKTAKVSPNNASSHDFTPIFRCVGGIQQQNCYMFCFVLFSIIFYKKKHFFI